MRYFILICICLFGCAKGSNRPIFTPKQQLVQDKYASEFDKALSDFTPELYQNPKDCDYTLWAGKAASIGLPVKMDLVEYTSGYVHRRPKDQGECWPDHSKSTTSNDMLTGYMGARFRLKDGLAIQRLSRFAVSHAFIMGEPSTALSEVFLKPALSILLARMDSKIVGEDTLGMSQWTPDYLPVTDDYAQHIQILQIAYHGEAHGSITDQMKDRLTEVIGEHPSNYTFQAVSAVYSGQFDTVYDLLLNDTTPNPSYVRGERPDVYAKIEWLWAANLVVNQMEKNNGNGMWR